MGDVISRLYHHLPRIETWELGGFNLGLEGVQIFTITVSPGAYSIGSLDKHQSSFRDLHFYTEINHLYVCDGTSCGLLKVI